ncbi:MAG TPA: 50S ribosomal protein L22 [Sumerlaeia bacterium]|nr:50S ribosomal protein L22 [Sumerlaeia bacterium]
MAPFDESQIASEASARFQRVSARKARFVADLIRGRKVGDAFQTLHFTHRPSAAPILRNLLKSAVANVDHSVHSDTDELVIGELKVDGGPIIYRGRPRARGRMYRIRKRLCHISIKLIAEQ